MTVDELKAAIERRGYAVDVRYYEEHTVEFRISAGERRANRAYTLEDLNQVQLSAHDFVESMLYTFAQGWQHVQCVQCGAPLLASFKWVDVPGVALKWYGVCSVQAGPYTEHLEVCPGCGIEFSYPPPPLKEIADG